MYNLGEVFTVNSLVFPYIHYSLEVWINTYKSTIYSVFVAQKKAARLFYKAKFNDDTNEFLLHENLRTRRFYEIQASSLMFIPKNGTLVHGTSKI